MLHPARRAGVATWAASVGIAHRRYERTGHVGRERPQDRAATQAIGCERRQIARRRTEEEEAEAFFLRERRRRRRIPSAIARAASQKRGCERRYRAGRSGGLRPPDEIANAAASVGNRAPAVVRRRERRRSSSASDDELGRSRRDARAAAQKRGASSRQNKWVWAPPSMSCRGPLGSRS